MKLLLFTRARLRAQPNRFDATNAAGTPARVPREDRAPRLRCVWSRDGEGRLACRWLREDSRTDDDAIPAAAMRRFPLTSARVSTATHDRAWAAATAVRHCGARIVQVPARRGR